MAGQTVLVLEYARPARARGWLPFGGTAVGMALAGVVANLAFIALTVANLHGAHWMYRDLVRDPRSYGREIAPEQIESLREPLRLWLSSSMFIAAAALGMLLAIHLLLAAGAAKGNAALSHRRLEGYARWKGFGAAATALAFFWAGWEYHEVVVTATRHVSIGSGPPFISTAVLWLCAMVPLWWVRRRVRGSW